MKYIAFFWLFWVAASMGTAAESEARGGSPQTLARASFEALQRQDFAGFVKMFHPDETDRFQQFAREVFEYPQPDDEIRQMRELFKPYDSAESVRKATGVDLLTAFLTNIFTARPEFLEILREAEVEILGTIEETPEKVHVVARTVLPRPSPISCRKSDGRWHLLLNQEVMQVMTALERKEHFRKKAVSPDELARALKMEEVQIVGHVADGPDLAQVLCRTKLKLDDFTFAVFGCYPVRKGEPAWQHLNDKDPTKLEQALLTKWEN